MATKSFANHLITDELSYNLSRKYPFGHTFKWWVLGIFTFFTALLTVFNVAVNGFDKGLKYTTDPVAIGTQMHWFNNLIFTWGSDSLTPKCQSVQIPVGYRFITTNLGFQYTVTRIAGSGAAKPRQQRAAISYHNDILEDCDIINISIRLKKSDSAPPQRIQDNFARWSWQESYALAVAQCKITTKDGNFTLELQVKYEPQIYQHSFIANDDLKTNAALWWGARLLNPYFAGIQHTMLQYLPDDYEKTPTYTRATMNFETRLDERNISIRDSQLYKFDYNFLRADGRNIGTGFFGEWSDSIILFNNASIALSRPFTEALMWNKIFRSAILADLGNTKAENLLTNETLLRYILDPDDDFNRVPGAPLKPAEMSNWRWMFAAIPPGNSKMSPIFLNESFDIFRDQFDTLETKPAFIFAEYICSVPGPRNPLAMVMFTLVANLALFHSAWALFKYVADRRVSWVDEQSSWCEGCIDLRRVLQQSEMSNNIRTAPKRGTREGIEMIEGDPSCRGGQIPEEDQTHTNDSFSEDEGEAEASISMGVTLRSESSSTQRLIPN